MVVDSIYYNVHFTIAESCDHVHGNCQLLVVARLFKIHCLVIPSMSLVILRAARISEPAAASTPSNLMPEDQHKINI
jgi:hypothetical protein